MSFDEERKRPFFSNVIDCFNTAICDPTALQDLNGLIRRAANAEGGGVVEQFDADVNLSDFDDVTWQRTRDLALCGFILGVVAARGSIESPEAWLAAWALPSGTPH
jgi:hypothetical protein